ncbi:hypothetical protein POM88_028860 [Heracleum sosnowskyi]|uniref:Uncharacterized protein n=1 Tax=Heracleum sosnowskyi TaxID=360622 RepID=A0AAD8HSN2_9APIA|nr:hypothetical protein POM88_028860 [Heracleum sosnowskyi]
MQMLTMLRICVCMMEITLRLLVLILLPLKTLHLTRCGSLKPMNNWVLPSLTSSYLRNVEFGDHISGFENLKEFTLSGCPDCFRDFEDDFTINCPNLERLALGPDFSHCDMLVYTPKLSYFEFRSGHVPRFSAGDGFPCIKEVDIDIELRDNVKLIYSLSWT